MQQATCAHSGAGTVTSSGNVPEYSTTRRNILGALAVASAGAALAVPIATAAAPAWDARDWVQRWDRLGCGLRLDGHGNVQLTPRSGAGLEAAPLLAELNSVSRIEALREVLERADLGCGATRHVERLEQIDREFVSEDDDPAGNEAWVERWASAYERLEHIPARTTRGLSAKLRQGIEGNGSEAGDRIIAAALRQLEQWA